MPKYIVRVENDILNESLEEVDLNLTEFFKIIDQYADNKDTLNNFFILIDEDHPIPVYLSALKILKNNIDRYKLSVSNLPFLNYAIGYDKGIKSDINPKVDKPQFRIKKILGIFENKINPFPIVSIIFEDEDQPPTSPTHRFNEESWRKYGVQIGKEKLAWDFVLKNPELFKDKIGINWSFLKETNINKKNNEDSDKKLKVNQIAIIHAYEGKQITRANADKIAASYGYMANTSGEGLFQDYLKYCSAANRKGKPSSCTPKKLKNKIQLFQSILEQLSKDAKSRALDEINILKTLYENEY